MSSYKTATINKTMRISQYGDSTNAYNLNHNYFFFTPRL